MRAHRKWGQRIGGDSAFVIIHTTLVVIGEIDALRGVIQPRFDAVTYACSGCVDAMLIVKIDDESGRGAHDIAGVEGTGIEINLDLGTLNIGGGGGVRSADQDMRGIRGAI